MSEKEIEDERHYQKENGPRRYGLMGGRDEKDTGCEVLGTETDPL